MFKHVSHWQDDLLPEAGAAQRCASHTLSMHDGNFIILLVPGALLVCLAHRLPCLVPADVLCLTCRVKAAVSDIESVL